MATMPWPPTVLDALPAPVLTQDFAGGCTRIEFLSREDFIGCCLGLRWSRATGKSADTWEGVMRRKWIGLSLSQTQFDAGDVPDIIPPETIKAIRANLERIKWRPRCKKKSK